MSKGRESADRYIELLYQQLRRLAAHYMSDEGPEHSLTPTAVVNEAYLRLEKIDQVEWKGQEHYFAMAAREMRRVLVDHARARKTSKRGGELQRVQLDERIAVTPDGLVDVLDLDRALERLAARNPRQAQVAELRLFTGLNVEETARALEVSPRTVDSDWRVARAWLVRELE